MQNLITQKIKKNNVKLQNFVNRIDKDLKIDKQYKEFVNEFRNIHKNIEYDYQNIELLNIRISELLNMIIRLIKI